MNAMLLLSHVEMSSIVVSANLLGILCSRPEHHRARGESVFVRSSVAGSVAGVSFFKGSDGKMSSEGGELSSEIGKMAESFTIALSTRLLMSLLLVRELSTSMTADSLGKSSSKKQTSQEAISLPFSRSSRW